MGAEVGANSATSGQSGHFFGESSPTLDNFDKQWQLLAEVWSMFGHLWRKHGRSQNMLPEFYHREVRRASAFARNLRNVHTSRLSNSAATSGKP